MVNVFLNIFFLLPAFPGATVKELCLVCERMPNYSKLTMFSAGQMNLGWGLDVSE